MQLGRISTGDMPEGADGPILSKPQKSTRHCVLLQGPSSLFFKGLGRALRRRCARVTRIGFAPGDRLYWSRSSGDFIRCAVAAKAFPDWIRDFVRDEGPTDFIMLGDGRYYHRHAIKAARECDNTVRTHVIEHGLFRPGWILVDPDGLGGSSKIPVRFAEAERIAAVEPSLARGANFVEYALLDIGYHASNAVAGWIFNPNYVPHTPVSPYREYRGWIMKLLRRQKTVAADDASLENLKAVASSAKVYLLPLQLETDFQIRNHGRGLALVEHLRRIIASFAENAPRPAVLVVKRHPLDNGLRDWRLFVRREAERHDIADALLYLDKCDLNSLLEICDGVVTVNSTVGLDAIMRGVPCVTTGTAVYDLPELTAQGSLDSFWSNPAPPVPETAHRFRDFLLARYHVPGSFDGSGRQTGAEALAERILS